MKRLGDLAEIVETVRTANHPEAFVTVELVGKGALVQLVRDGDDVRLFLNTTGQGGTLAELREATRDLDVAIERLAGHEGTEHVLLRGSPPEQADAALAVLRAVFGTSAETEVALPERGLSQLERTGTETSGTPVTPGSPRREPAWIGSLGRIALVLIGMGGLAAGSAAWRSWRLTGDLVGYPLPTSVQVVLGLGYLVLLLGLGLGAFWAFREFTREGRPGAVLFRPLVGDRHPLARLSGRLVRGVLAADRNVRTLGAAVLGPAVVVLLVWEAFHDPLVAWILGGSSVVLVLVYWLGRSA